MFRVWPGIHCLSRRSIKASHLSLVVSPVLLYAFNCRPGLTVCRNRYDLYILLTFLWCKSNTSLFLSLEVVSTCLLDAFPKLFKSKRALLTIGISCALYLLGLPCVTRVSAFQCKFFCHMPCWKPTLFMVCVWNRQEYTGWRSLTSSSAPGCCLSWVWWRWLGSRTFMVYSWYMWYKLIKMTETSETQLCIYWPFTGGNRFIKDIEMMLGEKTFCFWFWWRACWFFISPCIISVRIKWHSGRLSKSTVSFK